MPIEELTARSARERQKARRDARWPRPGNEDRLYPVALPTFDPPFELAKTDSVYCIGSCFAREIEGELSRLGYDVLSEPKRHFPERPPGAANRYSVPVIAREVARTLEAPASEGAPLPGLRDADVVVLTLGLSEAFFDRETGEYLNTAPSPRDFRSEPERYLHRTLGLEETRGALEGLLDSLQSMRPKGTRLLVTVSPIPLLSTFREQDVLTANAYSKAVLRVAVEEAIVGRPSVGYFPAFEMATLSDPAAVWSDGDYRHVRRDFVRLIVGHAIAGLVPGAAPVDPHPVRERLRTPQQTNGAARLLEEKLAARVLGPRLLRKYLRDRKAFFEDSGHPAVRWYGRVTTR